MIRKIIKYCLDYILPARCALCSEFIQNDGCFCGSCWKNLEFTTKPFCISCGRRFSLDIADGYSCGKCIKDPPSYDFARSLLKFNDSCKRLMHLFKYYDETILAKHFAYMLWARYLDTIKRADLIVPVPIHKLKRLMRKYNQSEILAKEISNISNKPVVYDALSKVKWTKPQTALVGKDRLKNLSGSIRAKNVDCVRDKSILLVDDVMTTGSTISLCAKLLKKAGAREVIVLCLSAT